MIWASARLKNHASGRDLKSIKGKRVAYLGTG